MFVFFKQMTAYEMRISDWSSDVCSSDLYVLDVGRRRIPSVFFMGFGPDAPGFKAAPFLRAGPRHWSGCACAFDPRLVRPLRTLPMNRGTDPSATMKENIMSDTNQNRPSHRLFTVKGEGANARWTDIGVAWATRAGKGFSLNLNALPLNVRVVMRITDAKIGSAHV